MNVYYKNLIINPYDSPLHAPCKLELRLDSKSIIENATINLGFLHSALEFDAEKTHILKLPYITGMADCKYSASSMLAMFLLLEQIFDFEISEYATILRTLMIETGRTTYFLRKIAKMTNLLGNEVIANKFSQFANQLEDFIAGEISQKSLLNFWRLAGIRNLPGSEFILNYEIFIDNFKKEFTQTQKILVESQQIKQRLQDTGKINADTAQNLSLSGIALRATGINSDFRKINNHLFYKHLDFTPVTANTGDTWARFTLMFSEIELSIKLNLQLLSTLTKFKPVSIIDQNIKKIQHLRDADSFDYIKGIEFLRLSPRFNKTGSFKISFEVEEGLLSHELILSETSIIRMHTTSPSLMNLQALEKALISNKIEDLPLIWHSFDISFSQAER